MITIDDKKILSYPVRIGDRGLAKYTLKVDDVSDLPEYNALPNYDIANGSTAYVIHEGKMYVFDSENKWYGTDGTAV